MLVECRKLSVQKGLLDGLISSLSSVLQLLCQSLILSLQEFKLAFISLVERILLLKLIDR